MAAVELPQKNVAIFDDFISSNNTNDDFDEITATLGDVDAYIEHQQKLKSERGGKRGGKGGGGRGGKKGGDGEGKEGGGEGGKRGGGGGRGGGEGGRGGGEGGEGGKRGGGGGRGGGEGGRGGAGGGEGGKRGGGGGGRGGGEGGGGRGGGEGAKRGGGGGRGGGRGGGAGGGEGGEGQAELRRRGNVVPVDDIDRLKKEAQRLDSERTGDGEGPGGMGGEGKGPGGKGGKGGKGKGGKGKGGKGGGKGKKQPVASVQGVVVMLIGTLCMSGSMTTMKLAAKMAPVVQVRFIRSLLCLVLAYFYATSYKKISVKFSELGNKTSLLMRVGMTVFQTFAQMYVARKLPLGLTAALMGMSPVTTSVLNYLVLKTAISAKQWACIFMTVVGVFLISQPAFLFGGDSGDFEEYDAEKYIAIALAIAMNVMRALTMILNRKMILAGGGKMHFSQFTFYNSLAASVLCLALLPFKGNVGYKMLEMPCWEAVALTALGAIVFFVRPLLMEVAGARLPANLITILRSSSIVWAFVFQLLIFGEIPNTMEAAGISVIVGCGSLMYHFTGAE